MGVLWLRKGTLTVIVTLCGSARFEELYHYWNERLTLAGYTVFSLAVFPSQKPAGKSWYTEEQKQELDAAHMRKIAASDAVFVIDGRRIDFRGYVV